MRFVENVVDYGDAPTFFASGLAAVNVVATGVIEIVLYRRVELPDGESENRIISRTIWAVDEWNDAALVESQAKAAMHNGSLLSTKAAVAKSH